MLQQIISSKVKRSIKDALLFTYPKVKVKVNQGIVKGCVEKLPNGRDYFRFSGIPYAQSPIGQLRFKSPQKLLKFDTEELDCTRERSKCFHRSTVLKKFIGSEDCLNLNVYVPADSNDKKYSVMVFIHGGGFIFDSNSVDFYSPEYLLMEDVIVVTINYRLHALGFLSLPSMGISGNAGLKDQQMALEWVYENIEHFNGDAQNICLFGESAGGSSVYLQTLSQKSRKFIKSAICQSGTAVDTWLMQRNGLEKTKRMAKLVGAKGESDEEIYAALMKATPEELFRNLLKILDPDEFRRNLPFAMKPTIEEESDDAFMTQSPLDLIKSQAGQINIPMIMGKTSGDGMTMTSFFMKSLKNFNDDRVRMIPQNIKVDLMSEEVKILAEKISEFYFGKDGLTNEKIPQFIKLMTDIYFNVPQTMHARLNQIYHPNITQYLYEFDFDGKLNFLKKALKMTKFKETCHFDELGYLFRHQIIDVNVSKDSREYKMRERMCKLWTNFAKYGNPTPSHNNPLPSNWDPLKPTDKDLNYMILSENPRMEVNLHSERIELWKTIYEKYNSSFFDPKVL
ncbi:hypothetical protein PVAND_007500 [Polypedilum vanderplanki]|uniref:carboxylesterase n=1 Tax=Polypedilum vanderplanki TaxID=319348 RepID=A0A9J6C6Q3_POLVA|nr:hypothetical protein PVAND_007500 [Polypedilum vanderplanki]